MKCPECGGDCGRDEVDNGIMVLMGPWGCGCGWSEDAEYRHLEKFDAKGGYTPPKLPGGLDDAGAAYLTSPAISAEERAGRIMSMVTDDNADLRGYYFARRVIAYVLDVCEKRR